MHNRNLFFRCAWLALALLTIAAIPARAFDAPAIVGTWDCVSTTNDGDEQTWTLTVKQDNGNLVATLGGGSLGDVGVEDFRAEGTTASFVAKTNSGSYGVKLTVKGSAVEGTFDGDQASGTIKGKKQS